MYCTVYLISRLFLYRFTPPTGAIPLRNNILDEHKLYQVTIPGYEDNIYQAMNCSRDGGGRKKSFAFALPVVVGPQGLRPVLYGHFQRAATKRTHPGMAVTAKKRIAMIEEVSSFTIVVTSPDIPDLRPNILLDTYDSQFQYDDCRGDMPACDAHMWESSADGN